MSVEALGSVPIFKVWADDEKHPPVALNRQVCVVGRQEGSNLVLTSARVSKVHALLVREQHRVYVRDLASTNGIQVNGAAVQEAALADTDLLRIGGYTLCCDSGFSAASDAGATVPPAQLRLDDSTFTFSPDRRTALIGRREGCDIRVDDPSVAPVHAIIFDLDGQRFVHDLGAPGGTLLNGRPIHRKELNAGDEVQVGKTSLHYEVSEEAAEDVQPLLEVATESVEEAVTSGADELEIEPLSDEAPVEVASDEAEPIEVIDDVEEVDVVDEVETVDEVEEVVEVEEVAEAEDVVETVDEEPAEETDEIAAEPEAIEVAPSHVEVSEAAPPPAPAPAAPVAAAVESYDVDDIGAFPPFDLSVPESELPPATFVAPAMEPVAEQINWDVEVPPADAGTIPLATVQGPTPAAEEPESPKPKKSKPRKKRNA
jgi:pSer/pThr/pTyr-binding forkhead associated (FHA) protein